MMNLTFPVTPPGTIVTGICPVDGAWQLIGQDDTHVAVKFLDTGNSSVIAKGGKIFDQRKRERSGDPSYWHDVAMTMKGYTYPNGRVVRDVLSSTRVILEDGGVVRSDYRGEVPKIRSKKAYSKWLLIMQQPENVADEWKEFEVFQQWFENNLPKTKRRWSLRSVAGSWSPSGCGFDDRTDLPVSSATLIDSVFTR